MWRNQAVNFPPLTTTRAPLSFEKCSSHSAHSTWRIYTTQVSHDISVHTHTCHNRNICRIIFFVRLSLSYCFPFSPFIFLLSNDSDTMTRGWQRGVFKCALVFLYTSVFQLKSGITKYQSTRFAQVTGLLSHCWYKQTQISYSPSRTLISLLKWIFAHLNAHR